MVQVDVFWAYGFGASLATAAARPLAKVEKPFESKQFVQTVLFLALIWAPTGLLLLLRHPSWETMQAAESLAHIPPWVTLMFGITNVTQGMLGFAVGLWLMKRERIWEAQLNWMFGYFGMFFILIYGWDGLGYDRFFYDRDMLAGSPAWTAGAGTGVGVAGFVTGVLAFLKSSVLVTLLIDGVFLIPAFAWLMLRWQTDSRHVVEQAPQVRVPKPPRLVVAYVTGVFVVALGGAGLCALIVAGIGTLLGVPDHVARSLGEVPPATGMHIVSYVVGLPIGMALLYWLVDLRRVGRLFAPLCFELAPPAAKSSAADPEAEPVAIAS